MGKSVKGVVPLCGTVNGNLFLDLFCYVERGDWILCCDVKGYEECEIGFDEKKGWFVVSDLRTIVVRASRRNKLDRLKGDDLPERKYMPRLAQRVRELEKQVEELGQRLRRIEGQNSNGPSE